MNSEFSFSAIGFIHSCYPQKFGIPRQAGLSPSAQSTIMIQKPFNRIEAFESLSSASHIWVQFVFHANSRQSWKPKVKAPRLGGNKSISVFATRSPVRPNPIGLSAVKLESINYQNGELSLLISGGDFLDGTPVLDIKPYIPYCDHIDDAHNDFAEAPPKVMHIEFSEQVEKAMASATIDNFKEIIRETLALNPAPQYQNQDTARRYALALFDYDIHWQFENDEQILVLALKRTR